MKRVVLIILIALAVTVSTLGFVAHEGNTPVDPKYEYNQVKDLPSTCDCFPWLFFCPDK